MTPPRIKVNSKLFNACKTVNISNQPKEMKKSLL